MPQRGYLNFLFANCNVLDITEELTVLYKLVLRKLSADLFGITKNIIGGTGS